MKDRIIFVEKAKWKSIVLTDRELWLSKEKIKSLETFGAAVNHPHQVKVVAYKYPLEKLVKLKFNETSDTVQYEYPMSRGNKVINLKFNDEKQANEFGNYLGEQLQFKKTEFAESKLKPLLLNAFYVLVAIALTYGFGLYFDEADFESSSSSSRRNGGGRAIVRILYNTIGQTGLLIIGGLITLYLIYQLYQRFQHPAKDVVYER